MPRPPTHRQPASAPINVLPQLEWRTLAAFLALVVLGGVSAAIYYRALVQPYSLVRYVTQPLLDLGKIGGYDPAAGRRYTLPLLALWAIYVVAGLLAQSVKGERRLLAIAFGGGGVCALLLLWLYPITAADIFNYLMYGLVQHQGRNPLVTPPDTVIGDPLIGYSAWPGHPSPYGPFWQVIAWVVTAITGQRLLAGIILFKAVLICCHLLNIALVALLAARSARLRPGVAALLYAWNPLLLYETAGNGHNDIVSLTALLLALVALTTPQVGASKWAARAPILALPLATLAVLAKYAAGIWLPVLLLAWLPLAWRQRRLPSLVWSLLGSVALTVLCFAPFWAGDATLEGVRRQADLYTSSLGGLVMIRLAERAVLADPLHLLDLIKLTALAIVALTMLVTRPRSCSIAELARALFDVTLAYLLVGALWFQPWYLVPLAGLAGLVGPVRRTLALVYALGATGSYVVYFYLWPALDWNPDRLVIQGWAVGVAHGPALVLLALLAVTALVRIRFAPAQRATMRVSRRASLSQH